MTIIKTSKWVEENDSDTFEFLEGKIMGFVADNTNTCNESWLESWKSEGFVQYEINEKSVGYIAGLSEQEIANQPTWGEDRIEDCEDLVEILIQD